MVYLNVGGAVFCTTRRTLLDSNSFFSGLACTVEGTEIFVDRDPTYFRHILNWMRGVRFLPDDDTSLQELAFETDYYAMSDMLECIRKRRMCSVPGIHVSLSKLVSRV
jgi:hypothetical protein